MARSPDKRPKPAKRRKKSVAQQSKKDKLTSRSRARNMKPDTSQERVEKEREKLTQKRQLDKEQKQEKRRDDEFLEHERKQKQQKRQDEEFRNLERERDTTQKKSKRKHEDFRSRERKSAAIATKKKRENEEVAKKLREREKQSKKALRNDEYYRYREQYKHNLQKQAKSPHVVAKLKVIEAQKEVPDRVCTCCEGLFFRNSVMSFNSETVKTKLHNFTEEKADDFMRRVINIESRFICRTCRRYVIQGLVPKLATSNGLRFAELPRCITDLSDLEERMVAPYINFMQIKALKPFALKPQLSLKGSVVNIAVEIDEMLKVLPRSFDKMATIQIKLKRHLAHKSNYMNEVIRPAHVCEALKFLIDTPLYKKYGITIDRDYFERFEGQSNAEIKFIVDEEDNDEDESTAAAAPDDQMETTKKLVVLLDRMNLEEDDEEGDSHDVEERATGKRTGDADVLSDLDYDWNDEEWDDNARDDEVLLIDRNREVVVADVDKIQVIAPGQDKQPLPWHVVEDIDELSFPRVFGGHGFETKGKRISYSERAKSEARRSDRRSCKATRVLYMAKQKLERACVANVNMCLRRVKRTERVTAEHVLDKKYISDIIRYDAGYKVLNQIRSSPAFWESKKKQLLAMIRQLGPPTLFLTVSAAEMKWPELMMTLYKLTEKKHISMAEILNLSDSEKCELIKSDPVTCARYYDYKINRLMEYVRCAGGPFQGFKVVDSYERVEFQARGSPHEHIFLWLEGAPEYDPEDGRSDKECVDFIDKLVTCKYDETIPYVQFQRHKHKDTCYKGQKSRNKCRFNFPKPVMPETVILRPLAKEREKDDVEVASQNWRKINELMKSLQKSRQSVTFEEILSQLNLTRDEYMLAIRAKLTRTQVFLKRTTLEIDVNAYNADIINVFEANMDLQFVLDAYSCASYIINYISKIDSGMTKLLKDAAKDVEDGNVGIKERLRKVANVFINGSVLSAQEAAYHILSLHLSKSSRGAVFVNTSPIEERVRMLKSPILLEELNKDSTDIYYRNIHEKYARRIAKLQDVCLADFAAIYKKPEERRSDDENDEDNEDETEEQAEDRKNMRQRPLILRYRRYVLIKDRSNYYREQLCLFLPWRNEESEIQNVAHEEKYKEHLDTIIKNRNKYCVADEDLMEEAMMNVHNEMSNIDREERERFEADRLSESEEVDILQQGGVDKEQKKKKDPTINRFTVPKPILHEDICERMQSLNEEQRKIVMHILYCMKNNRVPLNILLTGSAGVGKSLVISTIYQILSTYFNSLPGREIDKVWVLLCAPSGKAAFLIEGVTLHTAFALPVTQFGGQMPELSADLANSIRAKLSNLKLLIIDEISMVGSTLLSRVDTRLRQIMGIDENFGGVSVLAVGDLKQLPPVMDRYVFQQASTTGMCVLVDSPLWERFTYFELTTIMRQKNELQFVEALNHLANGEMTKADIRLIEGRIVDPSEVPESCIRLYTTNDLVSWYNDEKISRHPGETFISLASHSIIPPVSKIKTDKLIKSIKNKKMVETGGLPYETHFKIGIKYMLTVNLDVEDGLVNGACGLLKHITFSQSDEEAIKIVWLQFAEKRVGLKKKVAFKELKDEDGISEELIPFERSVNPINTSASMKYEIRRKQFPLVPAEALTVHKSQGQTYSEVCIDLKLNRRITRSLLYVAFSRVTKLDGLYVIGKFKPPKPPKPDDPVMNEIERLKAKRRLSLFSDVASRCPSKIIYQNIRSLSKNLKNITCDEWYSLCDLLIFSETCTIASDAFEIPDFKILHRTDEKMKSRRKRGVICFVRNAANVEVLEHVQRFERKPTNNEYKGHVDLLALRYEDVTLITGYRSPGAADRPFIDDFKKIISQHNNGNVVVMGDFNYDMSEEGQQNAFKTLMAEYKLRNALSSGTVTTDLVTQIDVVFTDREKFTAGVYETYFSDHKPIYFSTCEESRETSEGDDDDDKDHQRATKKIEKGVKKECPWKSFAKSKAHTNTSRNTRNENTTDRTETDLHREVLQNANERRTEDVVEPAGRHTVTAAWNDYHSEFPLYDMDKDCILDSRAVLSDEVINNFGELLNHFSSHEREINENHFEPQNVNFGHGELQENIRPVSDRPHIQILYGGALAGEENAIGHWICTYYDRTNINVFDSLNYRHFVYSGHETYLRRLHPHRSRIVFLKVQQQSNDVDCGLFAIAFAVSLYFNDHPSEIQYAEKEMRQHLWRMLTERVFERFPQHPIAADLLPTVSNDDRSEFPLNNADKACILDTRATDRRKADLHREGLQNANERLTEDVVEPAERHIVTAAWNNYDSKFPLFNTDKKCILDTRAVLSDQVINNFGELLSHFSSHDDAINRHHFKPQDVIYSYEELQRHIRPINDRPHIQILYGGPLTGQTKKVKTNTIGHWICTYYDRTNINVFDSLNSESFVYPGHETYLRRLHPHRSHIVFHKVQQQSNEVDCGLFAIAFAVSLYFNDHPSHIRYAERKMRQHLWRMLTDRVFERFSQRRIPANSLPIAF